MSIFANVKNIFQPNGQATQVQQPSQQSADANQTVPNSTNTPINTTPAAGTVAAAGGDSSPLSNFADLWKNDTTVTPDTPFSFQSDPAKLMETARTVDFTQTLTPELRAKITAGGSEAQAAMIEAMNHTAQLTFAQSANATAKMVEHALQAQEARFKEILPSIIKQHQVTDTIRTSNPLLTNPAAAPMVEALQAQLTRKYPTATVAEIQNHMNDYLNGLGDMLTQSRANNSATSKPAVKEQDWSAFFQ